MLYTPDWRIDTTKILSKREMAAVLAELHRKAPRSVNTRMNLVVFRLARCCGLRVIEIAGLRLGDVRVGVERPHLVVRPTIAKGGHGRKMPLWWNRGDAQRYRRLGGHTAGPGRWRRRPAGVLAPAPAIRPAAGPPCAA